MRDARIGCGGSRGVLDEGLDRAVGPLPDLVELGEHEGVERFPREYALRAALGLALCRAGPSPEGIEHLREAARLLPPDRSSSEGTSLGTAAWLCGDKANDVARIAAERRAAQGRGAKP